MTSHIFARWFFCLLCLVVATFAARAITVEKASLEKLTKDSHLIVRGTIHSQTPFWDGQNINTRVEVRVSEILKGQHEETLVSFVNHGGQLGERGEEVTGVPQFTNGEEVVLFLVSWRNAFWIHSMVLGRFSVLEIDGRQSVVNDLNNVGLIDPVTKREIIDPTAKINQFELTPFLEEVRALAARSN